MRVIALVFACLACTSHGRRVQMPRTSDQPVPDSLKSLATLLQAEEPEAGFNVAGPSSSAAKKPSSLEPSRHAEIRMEESEAPAPAPAVKMSQALPFVECPPHLDGTYAGDVGFDPLNFGGMMNFKYLREAELKHGRICMLATLGYVVVDLGLRAPGAPQTVTSLQAHDVTVKSGHMLFLLFVIAIFESLSYVAVSEMTSGKTNRVPGDYGFDPMNFKNTDSYKNGFYPLAEIKNGRLAMLAFSGIVTASALYGKPFPYF